MQEGMEEDSVAQWLRWQCQEQSLSLREAAARTGLSHATISDIMKGGRPSPETIRKLAGGFGDGNKYRLALEDRLLILASYRRPQKEDLSQPVAALMDKLTGFNEAQLKVIGHFADFLKTLK